MTVAPATSETLYVLTGTNVGPFNTIWPCVDSSEVALALYSGGETLSLTLDTDFTLSGTAPLVNGFEVTLNAGLLPGGGWGANAAVALRRVTATGQPSSFGEAQGFSPAASEAALDVLSRQQQDSATKLSRSVRGPPGETFDPLPSAAARAGLALGFHAVTGAPIATDLSGPKGDPGANTMAVGLFADLAGVGIPVGTDLVQTSGHGADGVGGARYAATTNTGTTAYRIETSNGRWFELAELAPDLQMFGAVGDGATDDTSAIQAATAFCAASGRTLTGPPKTFKITGKVVISCACALDQTTLKASGIAGVAVEFSAGDATDPLTNLTAGPSALPQVVNASKTANGWAQAGVVGSVGLRIVGLLSTQVKVPRIEGFAIGLELTAFGVGCYWNTIFLGRIHNCKVGLKLVDGASGSVNSNRFIGGDIRFDSAEGANVSGVRCIQIASDDHSDNLFIGCSVEGDTPEYHIEDNGLYNHFLQLRYEATTPKALLGNASSRAQFTGGYRLEDLVISGAGAAAALSLGAWRQALSASAGAAGAVVARNLSSDAYPVFAAYDSNVNPVTQDIALSGWVAAMTGLGLQTKQHGDAFPRIQVGADGEIHIGDGTAAVADAPRFHSDGAGNVLYDGGDLQLNGSAWDQVRLRFGGYYLWVDGSGRLRIKGGAPASDIDGTIVGAQS